MKAKSIMAGVAVAALMGCNSGAPPTNGANAAAPPVAANAQKQAGGTAPSGAEGIIFAEYDRVCRDLSNADSLAQAAASGGWQPYAPDANSDAGKLLAFAEANVRPLLQGAEFSNLSYRKNAGGRELVLILSEVPAGPAQSTECRVYDFAAEAPPGDAVIASWTTAPPSQRIAEQGLTAYTWTPGFRDGLSQQSVVFLDRTSPLREQIPAVGLGITATRGAASAE